MQRRRQLQFRPVWFALAGVLVLILGLVGFARAAEFGTGDVYELKAGQVVQDDLYVSAGEIRIDGDVEGDLIAFGGTIVVNGNVRGDLMAAGGSIEVNGTVADDVRAAGAGITINGSVGDDLVAAAGGQVGAGFSYPMVVNGQSIQQGLFLTKDAVVNGDAYLVGGTGDLAGTVKGDLFAAMGTIQFSGTVGGNAELSGNTVDISDTAKVSGELKYETQTPATAPAGVAAQVTPIVRTPAAPVEEPLTNRMIGWLIRLARPGRCACTGCSDAVSVSTVHKRCGRTIEPQSVDGACLWFHRGTGCDSVYDGVCWARVAFLGILPWGAFDSVFPGRSMGHPLDGRADHCRLLFRHDFAAQQCEQIITTFPGRRDHPAVGARG
ncbi:MAG: polymer-forming cytoskeletal protein [Anaerolineales bacterium]|nr:polymer-forming cytoskeletal protein [Anaerolineales bacterium]